MRMNSTSANLIQRLMELQHVRGYLDEDSLRALAREEILPLHQIQELVSFYPHFRTAPVPAMEVALCRDVSCWLNGAAEARERLRAIIAGRTDVLVREASCLGRCDKAPALLVNGHPGSLPEVPQLLDPTTPKVPIPAPLPSWRLDPYDGRANHYGVVRSLLQQDRSTAATQALEVLKEAGLRGMGGAAFPTAAKWKLVRDQVATPKYVICNADESEPGTFKDRALLACAPHLVLEGMLLAALVSGADRGILFLRHEYEPERQVVEAELATLRAMGFPWEIEIFVSPGGYILGEETALLECLEGRRGEPRNKPPYPGTHGLFGRPTVINNVETLALVPGILKHGSEWWKRQGCPGFAGLKLMAISGHIERPGVYEVSMGTPIRTLLEMAGGVSGGRSLKAFAPGGASSPWLPASAIDVPIDFASLAKAGSMLGSGAVLVAAEGTSLLELATCGVRFFRNESCGKCVPCRLGSQKAVELLEATLEGRGDRQALAGLPELGETMAQTSICGLGQVALNPYLSLRQHFPEEFPSDTP